MSKNKLYAKRRGNIIARQLIYVNTNYQACLKTCFKIKLKISWVLNLKKNKPKTKCVKTENRSVVTRETEWVEELDEGGQRA